MAAWTCTFGSRTVTKWATLPWACQMVPTSAGGLPARARTTRAFWIGPFAQQLSVEASKKTSSQRETSPLKFSQFTTSTWGLSRNGGAKTTTALIRESNVCVLWGWQREEHTKVLAKRRLSNGRVLQTQPHACLKPLKKSFQSMSIPQIKLTIGQPSHSLQCCPAGRGYSWGGGAWHFWGWTSVSSCGGERERSTPKFLQKSRLSNGVSSKHK